VLPPAPPQPHSLPSGPGTLLPLGSTTPRIYTPPLTTGDPGPCGCGCALSPATSHGFEVDTFARDVVGEPLDKWQRWAAIHGLELLPDGRPRFRRLLLLVARQNGKTHLLKILTLYWLFVHRWPLILGMSTNLDYAKEAWEKTIETAEYTECLAAMVPARGIRRTNGEQTLTTSERCRYKIAASNRRGGRSLSIDRLVSDELREHQTWDSYNAAYPAMNARPYGQAWFLSNAGDDTSIVLNSLRDDAIRYIESGTGDPRLGILEWSGPDDCDLEDVDALAAANPNVGHRTDWDTLLGPARAAKEAGGEQEAGFRTENLCQRVNGMDPAVNIDAWVASGPPAMPAVPLDGPMRRRLALAWDLTPDGLHATVYAAAVGPDGLVYLDPVKSWTGVRASAELRRELPQLTAKIKPVVVGWIPSGPGASVAADLAKRKGVRSWAPPGVRVEAIREEVTQVCMGFAELVRSRGARHGGDPLLTAQLRTAAKGRRGDAWVFVRSRAGYVDAVYAAAAAAHLARTTPGPLQVDKVISVPR
jgi:hypothetical protein